MNILNKNEAMLILKVNDYIITNLSSGLSELNSEMVTKAHKFHIYYYITKMLAGLCNNYFCNLYHFPVVIVQFLNVKCGKLLEEYINMILNSFCWAVADDTLQIDVSKILKFISDNMELYPALNALNMLNVYYDVNCVPCMNFKNKIIFIH
ncbi:MULTISPECIES: hypothetical protein [Methanobacterium]|uniref:Uncharacterized protein n=1 Tax=Methanobacterium bryantii TaxID=2161 RepID=A0A2A2H3R2_METBR|nr:MULTISPECIES: hypothetical protein [Methanobacterium]OEC86076.1 hypothetical protein A9507_11515 [Methanobacterium sp. A39]PAV03933.1 hypothetical protein ASJ80_02650 [Methanobacterium bryantii]